MIMEFSNKLQRMIFLKLTPRLQAIADSINQCEVLADIGTDHAHLPIYMMMEGRTKRAIASDINKGPIEIAQKRIRQYKLEHKIETRQGSGLAVLSPSEADTIVIAGMGGILISEILEQSRAVAEAAEILIMQPMQDSGDLRRYLLQSGFEIIDEELAKEDRKIYEIIWAEYTGEKQQISALMDIGPRIIEKKHPLAIELIDKKMAELKNIIQKLENTETELALKRMQECRALLKYYDEVREWVL